MTRAVLALSLTPLFSALLSACFTSSSCDDFTGGTFHRILELTPDEYAQQAAGGTSTPTTGGETTSGETTGTTPDDTTGEAVMLTPQEVCLAVCTPESPTGDVISCSVGEPNEAGNIPIDCEFQNVCEGRHHACIHRPELRSSPTAAAWLARAAHDEAASVHAFTALVAELAAHGAPGSLLTRLSAAAADESRHAAVITRLAHQHGAAVPIPSTSVLPTRDLLTIALENAREGCVLETWAALCAAHQARHAADPRTRALYAQISADEARHAELAWSLDSWLLGQLTTAERTTVEHARRTAITELQTSLARRPHGPELTALGLPDPTTAARLAAALDTTLWSAAA